MADLPLGIRLSRALGFDPRQLRAPDAQDELLRLQRYRDTAPAGTPQSEVNRRAGLEHDAWAYNLVRQHPWWGPAIGAAGIAAYEPAKALGVVRGRSDPSLHSFLMGMGGLARGIEQNLQGARRPLTRRPTGLGDVFGP